MTDEHAERYGSLHAELGLFSEFGDGRAVSVPAADVALRCRLDERELDRKRRALARHASQTTALAELVGEDVFRVWWRDETFRRPTPSRRGALVSGAAR